MVPSHDIDRIDNIGLGFRIRIYDLYELWLSMTKHNILNTYRYTRLSPPMVPFPRLGFRIRI